MLDTYADNIAHCLHCDHREEGCAGACKCTKSTRDIAEHAREGVCPLDLYGKPHPPELKRKHKGDFGARNLSLIEHAIELLPEYPGGFEGTGIVTAAGGEYFDCAYVQWRILRSLGYAGPIECFHFRGEIAEWMRDAAEPLEITFVEVEERLKTFPAMVTGKKRGYKLKPYAILASSFKDCLFLDADAYPIRREFNLFDTPEYRRTGAIFFPDSKHQDLNAGQWRAFGLPYAEEPAFESGAIFIDKARHWKTLSLALWFCERGDYWFNVVLGDKDTFHAAARLLAAPYAMPGRRWTWPDGSEPTPRGVEQAAMIQHDFDGRPLFVHRTVSKLSLTDSVGFDHFTTTRQLEQKRDDRLPMEEFAWDSLKDLADIRSKFLILHRLESNGDLLTLLPALKYLSRDRHVAIITHVKYAPLVEGIPWLKVIPFGGSPQDVSGAILISKHLGELRDIEPQPDARQRNWSLACWARTGVPVELFHSLPLEIENRDQETEDELVAEYVEGTRPLLLLNTCGKSSPYKHGDVLRDFLRQYADRIQILDLAFVQSPRIIDLLGLYERACCLVSTDTGTLHLGYATLTPTIALVNDPETPGPTPHVPGWRASEKRAHWLETLTYSESATAAGLKRIGEAMEKVFFVPELPPPSKSKSPRAAQLAMK